MNTFPSLWFLKLRFQYDFRFQLGLVTIDWLRNSEPATKSYSEFPINLNKSIANAC